MEEGENVNEVVFYDEAESSNSPPYSPPSLFVLNQGDAFKEAHGGASIGAFVKAMVSSLRVLKGPPKPAFYDGLLQLSSAPESVPKTVDGWRKIDADGKSVLSAESFVACNQFFVPEADAVAFEEVSTSDEQSR